MYHADPGAAVRQAVDEGYERLGRWLRAFEPELIIEFGPDHFNGFFYDLMPSFCIGVRATGAGDWGLPTNPFDVPEATARALHAALVGQGIEAAVSWRMQTDHGITQLVHRLTGKLDAVPLVPIFVNCAAPPQPSFRRTRQLGAAVGRFADSLGKRVMLMASGGLSHDPPVPILEGASAEVSEFMIAGRHPTPASRAAREERVKQAGTLFAAGSPDFVPLNPDWDKEFLRLIEQQDLAAMDGYDQQDISAIGGRGGHEIRAWVAGVSALAAVGPYRAQVDLYRPIPEWIAGFGMLRAAPVDSPGFDLDLSPLGKVPPITRRDNP